MKSYEITQSNGSTTYVSAKSKKEVLSFFFNPKPKKIKVRKDINPQDNFKIS